MLGEGSYGSVYKATYKDKVSPIVIILMKMTIMIKSDDDKSYILSFKFSISYEH